MHNFFTCSLMGCKGHYNYVKLDFSISAACNQKSYDDLFCVFLLIAVLANSWQSLTDTRYLPSISAILIQRIVEH